MKGQYFQCKTPARLEALKSSKLQPALIDTTCTCTYFHSYSYLGFGTPGIYACMYIVLNMCLHKHAHIPTLINHMHVEVITCNSCSAGLVGKGLWQHWDCSRVTCRVRSVGVAADALHNFQLGPQLGSIYKLNCPFLALGFLEYCDNAKKLSFPTESLFYCCINCCHGRFVLISMEHFFCSKSSVYNYHFNFI